MSAFETTPAVTTPANTEPVVQTTPTTESFVNKLVETKGANFSDPEVIAKSKLEADAYIATLEEQTKELREDLGKQDYAKKLLDQLQTKATDIAPVKTGESNTNNGNTNTDGVTKPLESGDIESLIKKALADKDVQSRTESNLSAVDAKLTELYGTEAKATIDKKGSELGLSVERLQAMAAESPKAFFALIGEEAPKMSNPVTQSTVNTSSAYTVTSERDANYYRKMRKDNPSEYYSPRVQQQQVDDLTRLGDKFNN
jgi:hypothetical protein